MQQMFDVKEWAMQIQTLKQKPLCLFGANLGVTMYAIGWKWKNLQKMIIVRNDKEITCGRSHQSKKDRQYTGPTEKGQIMFYKHFIETKDRATRIPLNTGGER